MDRRTCELHRYSPLESNKCNCADLSCSNENREYREIVEK